MPVQIPKPWGQEIWYTGMEARGESQVLIRTSGGSTAVPLSAYLAHNPGLLANHAPVLLLKVLDPKPADVVGDLYFEVHEEKQEVYVVSHIDTQAWPGGIGGIRFGMNQAKRQTYADGHAFRAAYLAAVQRYEQIRRQLDEQDASTANPAKDAAAAAAELTAREAMNDFASLRELRVGDVVKVPTWTPHSLLHGVRVVEFQTPTYERYIISFAQKVLTQDHWDSPHAITHMHIDAPALEKFEDVAPGIERIASFSDFNVWRIDLEASGELQLPAHIPYAVCMCLTAPVTAGALTLEAEHACFVPHAALEKIALRGSGKVLIAAPGL